MPPAHGAEKDHLVNREALDRQVARQLDLLARELAGTIPPEEIHSVGAQHLERLTRTAKIGDFVPLLVYRFTRDELRGGGTSTRRPIAA
jgi:hypothetical protein